MNQYKTGCYTINIIINYHQLSDYMSFSQFRAQCKSLSSKCLRSYVQSSEDAIVNNDANENLSELY